MRDDRNGKRWVENLGEAGCLDEFEDGWVLPERPSQKDARILVGDERGEASEEAPPRVTPVPSAKRTFSGIPAPVSSPPLPGDSWEEVVGSRRSAPPADRDPAVSAPERVERLTASPHGRRITVPPAPVEDDLGGVGTIEEEVPARDGAKQVLRETVRPGRGREWTAARARPDDETARMDELVELGDYSGALELAEELLRGAPKDAEATRVREHCRGVLLGMYESRLGPLDRVARLAVAENELIWRSLDPVSGFVLSRVDGFSSIEDIIDISGLPRFETCRILDRLFQEGLLRAD